MFKCVQLFSPHVFECQTQVTRLTRQARVFPHWAILLTYDPMCGWYLFAHYLLLLCSAHWNRTWAMSRHRWFYGLGRRAIKGPNWRLVSMEDACDVLNCSHHARAAWPSGCVRQILLGGVGAPWWSSELLYFCVMLENFMLVTLGKCLSSCYLADSKFNSLIH